MVDLAIAATSAPSASGPSPSEATLLLGRVEFQKVKYDLLLESGSKLTLQRVKYPTAAKVESFLKWTGMGIQSVKSKEVDTVKAALNQWGLNEYDIPIPQFLDLYLVTIGTNLESEVLIYFNITVVCIEPPGSAFLRVPGPLFVSMESRRLLDLQCVHSIDVAVLRGHDVSTATKFAYDAKKHETTSYPPAGLSIWAVGSATIGYDR